MRLDTDGGLNLTYFLVSGRRAAVFSFLSTHKKFNFLSFFWLKSDFFFSGRNKQLVFGKPYREFFFNEMDLFIDWFAIFNSTHYSVQLFAGYMIVMMKLGNY